ncbi:hypothetical protein ACRQ4B_06465 [Curtobacterium sp. SP.BCo]|uniref:hypothetical protein n=1 Tax=Curtobacterium sp. SP.BCo TaxID=3435229 RepID=UPI003F7324CE
MSAFWTAYVLTRPIGASFADWVAVPHARGGLDVGTGLVSAVLLIAIACTVAWSISVRALAVPADELGGSR